MFKRLGGRDEPWQIDITIGGRRIKRSLGTNNAEAAAARAIADLIRPARAGQWGTVDQTRLKDRFSSLGELLDMFVRLSDCRPFTRRGYSVAFLRVVRRGLGNDDMTDSAVRQQSSGVLTGQLVGAYEEWMHKSAEQAGRCAVSTKRSVAADLRNSRAVLKRELRPRFREGGLTLPDLTDFMERGTARAPRVVHLPAPDELIERTFAAANDLRQTDRMAYVAWLLGVSSLRRREISLARWSWAQRLRGRPYLVLDAAAAKSGSARAVAVDERVLAELDSFRQCEGAHPDYILPGPVGARLRGQAIFRRVDAWMRRLGWTTHHTMHEMRAYAVRRVRQEHGIEAAQAQAGHSCARTTIDHYAGERGVEDVTVTLPIV